MTRPMRLLSTVLFSLGTAAPAARAADMLPPPSRNPDFARLRPADPDWGGFYVAALADYAFGYKPLGLPNAVAGGGRLGADIQISDGFLVGAMIDGVLTDASGGGAVSATLSDTYRLRSLVSADVRVGLPFGWLMAYGVAGWTKGGIEVRQTGSAVTSPRFESAGYNVGAGAEYRFTAALGAFAEYRWNQLGNAHGARLGEVVSGVSLRF